MLSALVYFAVAAAVGAVAVLLYARRGGYVAKLTVAFALALLVIAAPSAVACDAALGQCGVPAFAPVYAQQFAPAYVAPQFVPQAAVYAAPQVVVRQRAVVAAPVYAVQAAPVVKQRVVVRQRTRLFGRRGVNVVTPGAAVAVGY